MCTAKGVRPNNDARRQQPTPECKPERQECFSLLNTLSCFTTLQYYIHIPTYFFSSATHRVAYAHTLFPQFMPPNGWSLRPSDCINITRVNYCYIHGRNSEQEAQFYGLKFFFLLCCASGPQLQLSGIADSTEATTSPVPARPW